MAIENKPIMKEQEESFELQTLKDNLTESAQQIENLRLIFSEMLTEFFYAFDVRKIEDVQLLAYSFKRYRAVADTCFDMICKAENNLHENDVYCYDDLM